MSKRCTQAVILPWLVMIPLGLLLALFGPTFIRHWEANTPATPVTTPPPR